MGPYRAAPYSSYEEDELWLRLDLALEYALKSPGRAYSIAWDLYMDARRYPDVREAASELLQRLL